MSELRKVSLSSSDGTYLTVSDLREAASKMRNAMARLKEINDGTYSWTQPPIQFDADTSQELLDIVGSCFYAAKDLVNYILHDEE